MRQKTPLKEIKTLDTRSKFQKEIDALLQVVPYALQQAEIQAKVSFGQYDKLVKAGFTQDQAMKIILEHPLWK